MIRKLSPVASVALIAALLGLAAAGPDAWALTRDRWTNAEPYGVFFNDYDPNFYTGFVPRVQDANRIKVHLGRGNQLRIRLILPDETIENFIPDQVAKHDLYKEVIDRGIIELTANTSWEDYDARFQAEGFPGLAAQRGSLSPAAWRSLNLKTIDALNPERLYHIQKNFNGMLDAWMRLLASADTTEELDLAAKLDLVNEIFPNRTFAWELSEEQDAAFSELLSLAGAGNAAAFRPKATAFFHDITGNIYAVRNGKIDYWEMTVIYPAGTYDTTTRWKGRTIPQITTPGVWFFMPRMRGNGMTGMIDYISGAGYYGLIPMFPYEYGGGSAYNSIHNTGISNWIAGHPLLPKEWRQYTEGSRNGKPYNRVALTSRGPVSHGCTRLNSGHLAELREMLPSTSDAMKGLVNYRNVSHCYDVFDRKGDGDVEIMGVQYYIAFRHTKSRVANQIWSQNNRDDFYAWMYGDEMNYGPIGQVTFPEVCTGKFVDRKAKVGKTYKNLKLWEAPYEPDSIQFYKIKGVNKLSPAGMEFNREMRRVGYGYTVDRQKLFLDRRDAPTASN